MTADARRIEALDLADDGVAERVLALQRAAYAVEAALIGRDDLPPLREDRAALRESGETFFGLFEGDELVGAVAYKRLADTLDVHRVAVHPTFFRRGIARALVAFAEAREADARRVVVQTGWDNAPAVRLYGALGFRAVGEREVAPGLHVALFEKRRP